MAKKFLQVVTEAVNDMLKHGYDTNERIEDWFRKLRDAARAALVPESKLTQTLKSALASKFLSATDRRRLIRLHPGVSEFTLAQIKPKLRAELDRRILASASLIKLNREASIQRTLARFVGWATSIPKGGSDAASRKEAKQNVRRAIAALPFQERRVIIDQGHKLTAAINDIVAVEGGAIAMIWHSHWRESGYNYREDHKDRDREIYLIRDSWALKRGLVKATGKFLDEITQPGEEPYCRCYGEYLYNLRDLPDAMLSAKGRGELVKVRKLIERSA